MYHHTPGQCRSQLGVGYPTVKSSQKACQSRPWQAAVCQHKECSAHYHTDDPVPHECCMCKRFLHSKLSRQCYCLVQDIVHTTLYGRALPAYNNKRLHELDRKMAGQARERESRKGKKRTVATSRIQELSGTLQIVLSVLEICAARPSTW